MFEEIVCLTGQEAGPKSIILAGVHGDETCGIEAFKKTLPDLKIERGQVLFAYGNPRAIEANKRFTEANLNRMFKNDNLLSEVEKTSYEYKRAQVLKSYLEQADALLDIHASFTPNSRPFIICEANAGGIIEYLPVDLIVSGFDEVEPGGTDYYMNSVGKIGICLECGYLGDPQATHIAEEGVFAFLKAQGHISGSVAQKEQSYIRVYKLYMTTNADFTLERSFADFERISEGQIIGTDGTNEVRAERESVILFARNRNKVGEEAFLLGERKNSLT